MSYLPNGEDDSVSYLKTGKDGFSVLSGTHIEISHSLFGWLLWLLSATLKRKYWSTGVTWFLCFECC